jgi:DNA repair ATPase RecN
VIPSSPTDRKKVWDAIREIDASLTRADAEKDHIKSILERIEEEYEIPKKYLRKVANTYHKQNFDQVSSDYEEVESLYEAVVPSSGGVPIETPE